MSTFDESQVKRQAAGSSAGGQFAQKQQSAPATELAQKREFAIATQGGSTVTVQAVSVDAALRTYLKSKYTYPEGFPVGFVQDAGDPPALTLVRDRYGEVYTLTEAFESTMLIDDMEFFQDELLMFGADEPTYLDQVAEWLRDGQQGPLSTVEAMLDVDDSGTVNVDINVFDNLLWNGYFTEEELDEHRDIVEQVYYEKFDAELDVPDNWSECTVSMRVKVAAGQATNSTIYNKAYKSYTKFLNQTDPGTFNSPYIGNEIRRRIDLRNSED
jgi:hypothetical protein